MNEETDPRARSNTERPVSWLPAPGLETTSTIKLVRRQRAAATTDFPTRTGVPLGISGAWKVGTHERARAGLTYALAGWVLYP
jgi:hypothetical protein